MIPKKWFPVFGLDHAQMENLLDFAVLKRRRML
jgi:hypothetical protein